MPSLSGAGRGALTGAAAGSFIPGIGTGIGAGIGGLIGLFKGGGDKKDDDKKTVAQPYLDQLQQSSDSMRQTGQDLEGGSQEALQPVLKYLKSVLSGNPTELLAATAPERGRVIDQYDSARKAIGQFGPRGGGTTSALAQSRISEAGDLADVTNTARRDAVGQAGALGSDLMGKSLSANQLASMDLNSLISAMFTREGLDLEKRGQNMALAGDIGQTVGSLVGLFATRGQGAA